MSAKFRFTAARIRALPDPEKRTSYRDEVQPKLYLRCTPSGSQTFYHVRRVGHRIEWLRLGGFPELSVTAAREASAAAAARFALGDNPAQERRETNAELTLADLWTEYFEDYKVRSGKSVRTLESQWDVWLKKKWGKRKLSAIKSTDVRRLKRKIATERSQSLANRVVSMLRAMFAFARSCDGLELDVDDPTAGISKFSEKGVRRHQRLRLSDVPRLLEGFAACTPTMRDFFTVVLLTGSRAGPVASMRWCDIDLDAGLWVVPTPKGGEPVEAALPGPAVELLVERRKAKPKSAFVFSADSKSGHLITWRKAWLKAVEVAALPGLRLHDLRRVWASLAQETAVPVAIAAAQLGHSDAATTLRHYTQHASEAQRHAVDAVARLMKGDDRE